MSEKKWSSCIFGDIFPAQICRYATHCDRSSEVGIGSQLFLLINWAVSWSSFNVWDICWIVNRLHAEAVWNAASLDYPKCCFCAMCQSRDEVLSSSYIPAAFHRASIVQILSSRGNLANIRRTTDGIFVLRSGTLWCPFDARYQRSRESYLIWSLRRCRVTSVILRWTLCNTVKRRQFAMSKMYESVHRVFPLVKHIELRLSRSSVRSSRRSSDWRTTQPVWSESAAVPFANQSVTFLQLNNWLGWSNVHQSPVVFWHGSMCVDVLRP